MSDEQTNIPAEQTEPATPAEEQAASSTPPSAFSESWQEVGRQFQELGKSLAAAVRTSWYDEENRKRLQAMQASLESMVHDVSQAVHERAVQPASQKARTGVERAGQEVRPRVVRALRSLNAELTRVITRMDQPGTEAPAAEAPVAPVTGEVPVPPEPPIPPIPPVPPAPPEAPTDSGKKWYEEPR